MRIPKEEVEIATIKCERMIQKPLGVGLKSEKCTVMISVARNDEQKFVIFRAYGPDNHTRNRIVLDDENLKAVIEGLQKARKVMDFTK